MKILQLASVLAAAWLSVFIETAIIPIRGGFFFLLQPALWAVFLFSLRLGPHQTLALSAVVGLLLDYWSILPFGITLSALVAAAAISRTAALSWFSHKPSLAAVLAVSSGHLIFLSLRDLFGLILKIFGAETAWIIEPRALAIQSTALFFNVLTASFVIILALPVKLALRRWFRLKSLKYVR